MYLFVAALLQSGEPWTRHTIDDFSRGADGVRLADVNGDGLADIVTGWEEGGVVRVCLNPGPKKCRDKWPALAVGPARSVEDAVLVDLDGDGALDVVSSCEGAVRRMNVHWATKNKAGAWSTEFFAPSIDLMQWMFCAPAQVDGRHGIDLFAGGKGKGAKIGWFEAPADPRKLAEWKWHALSDAGWVMSLIPEDIDGDGDIDVMVSDRKGKASGCFWMENPGRDAAWNTHPMGGQGREVMFARLAGPDVLVAVKPREILYLRRKTRDGKAWETEAIRIPDTCGTAKAVNAGDIDLDGKLDIVVTCEEARDGKSGVLWLTGPTWEPRALSGPDGVKHDLVELIDLDGDGDLDAITCEETKNLGVVWYENPTRKSQ